MRKPVPSYTDMIDLPDDPGEAPAKPVQADERMAVQSYEHTNTRKDEEVPVQDAVSAAPVVPDKPIDEMTFEEMGAALNASVRADMESQEREHAERKAAIARGEAPPLPKGVKVYHRRQRDPAPTVEAEPDKPVEVSPARPKAIREATRQARPAGVPSRREAARLRREAPKVEPADYDQRSLYARAETFELFRKLAFERRTTMQALYREGLLLVLEKYGVAKGMGPGDV